MEQKLTLTESQYCLTHGIGFNWYDFFGIGGCYAHAFKEYDLSDPTYPDLSDKASWTAIFDELSRLRPGIIRFGLPPDPHVDAAGKLLTDTVHFRRLDMLNHWAEANGSAIILDTFVLPQRYEQPIPPEQLTGSCTQFAAADNIVYAREFVAPLLSHVVKDRRLGAVRYFNPINEPMIYGVYQTPNNTPDQYICYVDMYRQIRSALDEADVPRSRLGLLGIDAVGPNNFCALEMFARGVDIDPFVDGYSIHFYNLRFDYLPSRPAVSITGPMEEVLDRATAKLVRYCTARNKPLFCTEIGTFYYGWRRGSPAGPSTFDACLTVAEGVIRGINAGLQSFAFWSLFNPNTIDGHFRIIAMHNGKIEPAEYPHQVYGTLSRHVRPGAVATPFRPAPSGTEPAYIHATALQNPDGSRVLLAVNDHPGLPVMVDAPLPIGWQDLPPTTLTLTRDGMHSQPASAIPKRSAWRDELPSMSLRVYCDAV